MLSETPAKPPIALPKYTFIVSGTPAERTALVRAIAARDMGMLIEDLTTPLRAATCQLFFDVVSPSYEAMLLQPPPFEHTAGTTEDWLESFDDALKAYAGPFALCQLSLQRVAEARSFATRFLWTDTSPEDAAWFTSRFGGVHCLLIWIGEGYSPPIARNVGFNISVYGSTEEQILQLEQTVESLPL